jgi:hypothetical protein
MTIITIDCSSPTTAETIVSAVQAGELWGVDMGTTSRASTYSDHVLIECTNTRNLALIDACPPGETYNIGYSISTPDSFTEAGAIEKAWFLRGKL